MPCHGHEINALHNVLRTTAQNILNTFHRTSDLACHSSMCRGCSMQRQVSGLWPKVSDTRHNPASGVRTVAEGVRHTPQSVEVSRRWRKLLNSIFFSSFHTVVLMITISMAVKHNNVLLNLITGCLYWLTTCFGLVKHCCV